MKNFVRFTASSLLIVVMLVLNILSAPFSTHVAASNIPNQKKQRENKVKGGPEVAVRVRQLKKSSKNVRAALKIFEDKKRMPKIEDSSALTGSLPSATARTNGCKTCELLQKASFAPQSSLGNGYVELTWVPDLSIDYEWHGTVIGDLYDDFGNLVDEYVANIVMVMPDHSLYQWDVVYETPIYNGVVQPPIDEPGMYTSVDLGSPLHGQQLELMPVANKKPNSVNRYGDASFTKVSMQQRRRSWRAWAKCSAAWGGGAVVGSMAGCAIASAWSAEILWAPCTVVGSVSGSIAGAIGCTYGTLWGL